MISKILLSKECITQVLLNLVLITVISCINQNVSIVVINIVLMLFFILLYQMVFIEKTDVVGLKEYIRTVNMYMIIMVITSYLFEFNLGTILGANDAAKHYYQSMALANISDVRAFPDMQIIGYTSLLSILLKIANIISLPSPYIGKILNVYCGAFIPILCANMLRNEIPVSFRKKIYLYTMIFPLTIYFATTLTRDIVIVLINTMVLHMLFSNEKSEMFKMCFSMVAIVYTSLLRIEASMFLSVMVGIYVVISMRSRITITKLILLIGICCVGLYAIINAKIIHDALFHVIEMREKYLNGQLDQGSLSYKIGTLPFPANIVGRFAVSIFGYFPPWNVMKTPFYGQAVMDHLIPINSKLLFDPGRISLVLGLVFWYFAVPYFIIYVFKHRKKTFRQVYLMAFILIYLLSTSFVTVELGRTQVVYPYAILLSVNTVKESSTNYRYAINIFVGLSLLLASLLYLFVALK